MPEIDPVKCYPSTDVEIPEDRTQKMQLEINKFFKHLMISHEQFESEGAFRELLSYIQEYDRILYSPISNIIYSSYENMSDEELTGTILSNLDELLFYVNDEAAMEKHNSECTGKRDKKSVEDAKKAVLKIWDHVNLANQQYRVLKQTDDEYDKMFRERIDSYKEDMMKEMNAQLLTMVSIFTALAFLVFGGISSLDNVFSISDIPLLKVIASGLVWGLCIFNLIFVFLFCVGKMTHLNFKSNSDPQTTIFQKYPIVWWSDLILVALLIICLWLYFL